MYSLIQFGVNVILGCALYQVFFIWFIFSGEATLSTLFIFGLLEVFILYGVFGNKFDKTNKRIGDLK